jgi:hypothetical protein
VLLGGRWKKVDIEEERVDVRAVVVLLEENGVSPRSGMGEEREQASGQLWINVQLREHAVQGSACA